MTNDHRRHEARLYEITERVREEIRGLRYSGLSLQDNRREFKRILRTGVADVEAETAAYDAQLKNDGGAE